jgi:hypothetical protein
MTAQQALDSADVVIVGTVVRKEPAHRWVSRAWSRHAPLWLGGNPIDADRAVAYVHVDDALKGGTVGAQIPVQALSDATQSTCSWENLRVGQLVLLFAKRDQRQPLIISHGLVPLDKVASRTYLDELKRLSLPVPPNNRMQRSGSP